jgi:hypothetical protein
MEAENKPREQQHSLAWLGVLLILATGVALWMYGAAYYTLPFSERPQAPLHAQLDPAHPIGHGFGVAGTIMMIVMMLYSLRKRMSFLQGAGALSQWLSLHIFLGLMGPLLVTFHTGFKIGGIVSIAYWSMIITMLSGIFGRYIYNQLPRDTAGGQLSPQDLQEEEERLATQIKGLLDNDASLIEQVDQAAPRSAALAASTSGWRSLLVLFAQDFDRLLARRRLHTLLRTHSDLGRAERRQVVGLAQRRAIIARRKITFDRMDQFFRYWHVLHRPFVWVMFAIIAVHIGVAVLFGYVWV